MPVHRTWHAIRELNRRVNDMGEPLALTDEPRARLIDAASNVAITPDAVALAFQSNASASELLGEVTKRIREGLWRLSRALTEATRRQEAGGLDGARAPLIELLAIEVVSFYRELAQAQLEALGEP
ncbi:DUSAM domain-containing protein [Myxococcus sp. AM009]|uniref:DUSAM domain-containing protein n=1 Tax=unclassified Myxococcus TaxID=2648731 RepID=UPI001595C92F|nr:MULTISPECIES: DUSAM domain-containing protein [unclassified Myxococcus]NVI99683.1 DUSAM domain-containing protein [Myxococcus sp. AM009]NVJ15786.1 DUSAM domain-containing protein [Myxococcus sp. AM010]